MPGDDIDQSLGGQLGTARGLTAVKWCVDKLRPHVQLGDHTAGAIWSLGGATWQLPNAYQIFH